MAEIRVENLHKAFGDFVAVKDSNFTVEDGEFFCLLGPSGCGKTTTLRMIAGLELPTVGPASCSAARTSPASAPRERDIAFVFQLFALYPHMNVRAEHRLSAASRRACRAAEIRQRVEEAARILRIDHLLDQPVSGLSGGDRQRVALGRAIVRRPMAFLMDEPLGALDAEFRELMCGELRELHDRLDATTVYVTHDQIEAMAMADKIAVMNQGVIEQLGTPQEIYDRPASDVRRRLHRLAADELPALRRRRCARGAHDDRGSTARDVAVPELREDVAEATLVLGVRPEHVRSRRRLGAARRGLRRRISRHHADRHRRRRARRHGQGAGSRPSVPVARRRARSGSRSRPEQLSLFDAASGGRAVLHSALHRREAAHG